MLEKNQDETEENEMEPMRYESFDVRKSEEIENVHGKWETQLGIGY